MGPQRRSITNCIKSSLEETTTAGPPHNVAAGVRMRRDLPVSVGAEIKQWAALRGTYMVLPAFAGGTKSLPPSVFECRWENPQYGVLGLTYTPR